MMISKTTMMRRSLGPMAATSSSSSIATSFWNVGTSTSTSQTTTKTKTTTNFNIQLRQKSTRPSLLDSASEYYASLRWKFATSLTESLPKEQQKELLGRINIVNDDVMTPAKEKYDNNNNTSVVVSSSPSKEEEEEEEQSMRNSIAEAVAAARMEEAQKHNKKWEEESAKLIAETEAAVKKRVENELIIQHRRVAFERWQQALQQEETETGEAKQEVYEENAATPTTATITTANDEVNTINADADDEQQQQQQQDQALSFSGEQEPIATIDHPVLGSAIYDLGYKRIHVASIAALKSLPVWKKQRTYRHKRAKSMANDKLKTLHLGIPGIIALHEDSTGQLSIIDGQHRVGMMTILEEKAMQETKQDDENAAADMLDLERILVEVYPEVKQSLDEKNYDESTMTPTAASSSSHAQDIFLEINKAEPVKLVDLPGIALTKSGRKTINEGAMRLEEAYPKMFSPSQRCRTPHLNIDNLRDALFASDVVKRHDLKSPKALESWMMEQNEKLRQEYTSGSSNSSSTKAKSIPKTALKKAVENDFFLGLDSSWLYN